IEKRDRTRVDERGASPEHPLHDEVGLRRDAAKCFGAERTRREKCGGKKRDRKGERAEGRRCAARSSRESATRVSKNCKAGPRSHCGTTCEGAGIDLRTALVSISAYTDVGGAIAPPAGSRSGNAGISAKAALGPSSDGNRRWRAEPANA